MHEGSRRAIIAALLANLGIALAKVVAFVITRSASMLAEAIHSFADTGNQADRKSTRLNSSHVSESRMPSSA